MFLNQIEILRCKTILPLVLCRVVCGDNRRGSPLKESKQKFNIINCLGGFLNKVWSDIKKIRSTEREFKTEI